MNDYFLIYAAIGCAYALLRVFQLSVALCGYAGILSPRKQATLKALVGTINAMQNDLPAVLAALVVTICVAYTSAMAAAFWPFFVGRNIRDRLRDAKGAGHE